MKAITLNQISDAITIAKEKYYQQFDFISPTGVKTQLLCGKSHNQMIVHFAKIATENKYEVFDNEWKRVTFEQKSNVTPFIVPAI